MTGVAVGLTTFHLTRHLFRSPDVYVGKDSRKSLIRDTQDKGNSFFAHRVRLSSIERSPQLFSGLNAKYGTAHDTSHLPENVRAEAVSQVRNMRK